MTDKGLRLIRKRERHAWCENRNCGWNQSSDRPVKGEDPIFAAAHLHFAQTNHPVTVQKVTTIRYLPEEAYNAD